MLDKKFSPERQTAFAARFEAQKIAFGPVVFQCVRYAWKRGMLQALSDAGGGGLTVAELAAGGRWTAYALKVVLETCLSAGVVYLSAGRYVLDKAGYCVLTDAITQINLDFNHDVCYEGLFKLDQSLDAEQPLGLSALGDWPTLYQGLSQMPEPAKSSWFAFDHHYSDTSFPSILPDVFATAPRRVMDVGANTGKFSCAALAYHPSVELHLVDLPRQLAVAAENLQKAGVRERAHLHPTDLLQTGLALAPGMDLIWMSQFLSCFSEAAIASILRRAADALAPQGQLLIMDTFWDRQRYDIASYCLINTSPYFTAMASGNSKIYESGDYIRLAQAAGLQLLTTRDDIGYCHSLLRFARAGV
ncbi:MAG: class I SAM-dependent methyltransferase [Burkholderiales bacterium]|nr:class I SAM-dependent methyltransferase [Burkholderiales bacterium]